MDSPLAVVRCKAGNVSRQRGSLVSTTFFSTGKPVIKFCYALRNLPTLIRSYFTLLGSKIGARCGAITMVGTLNVRVHRLCQYIPGYGLKFDFWTDYGMVSARKVTKAGVT